MTQWMSGRVARKTRWNDTHYSLAIEAEGPPFVAGQFIRIGVDLDGERVGRPYSLVNPPHEPISGCAISIAPALSRGRKPYIVCAFSPPAIGI